MSGSAAKLYGGSHLTDRKHHGAGQVCLPVALSLENGSHLSHSPQDQDVSSLLVRILSLTSVSSYHQTPCIHTGFHRTLDLQHDSWK